MKFAKAAENLQRLKAKASKEEPTPCVPKVDEEKEVCKEIKDNMYLIIDRKGLISKFSQKALELLQKAYSTKSPHVLKMYKSYQDKWFNFLKEKV